MRENDVLNKGITKISEEISSYGREENSEETPAIKEDSMETEDELKSEKGTPHLENIHDIKQQ